MKIDEYRIVEREKIIKMANKPKAENIFFIDETEEERAERIRTSKEEEEE